MTTLLGRFRWFPSGVVTGRAIFRSARIGPIVLFSFQGFTGSPSTICMFQDPITSILEPPGCYNSTFRLRWPFEDIRRRFHRKMRCRFRTLCSGFPYALNDYFSSEAAGMTTTHSSAAHDFKVSGSSFMSAEVHVFISVWCFRGSSSTYDTLHVLFFSLTRS